MEHNFENKNSKLHIWILFGVSAIVRFLLANYFPKTVNCYPDELLYLSTAEGLWNHGKILLFHMPSNFNKVGYSLLIAPIFAISNLKLRGVVLSIINSILISLGVFPIYGLSKHLLKNARYQYLSVVLYMISPTMTYSMTYMSEVLYVPLALTMVYLLCVIFDTNRRKRRICLEGIFVILLAAAYVTKPQAVAFPLALVILWIVEALISGKNKRKIIAIVVCIVGALASYAILKMGIRYTNLSLVEERLGYIGYGVGFYMAIVFIGCCILPWLIPIVEYSKMNPAGKRMFLFLGLFTVVTAAMVSVVIYATEDYPNLVLRAHLRYVEYIFVPLVILLFQVMENQRIGKSNGFGKWMVTLVLASAFLFGFFRGFLGQTIDQTTLFYWQIFAEDGQIIPLNRVRIILTLLIVVCGILIWLWEKKEQIFRNVIIVLLMLCCLGNTVLSVYVQYKTHSHTQAEFVEIQEIRSFIYENAQEQFLVLEPETYNEMLDTYLLDCENVRTGVEPVMTQDRNQFVAPKDITYYIAQEGDERLPNNVRIVKEFPALEYAMYECYK